MNITDITNYLKPLNILNCDNTNIIEISGISYNSKTTQKGDVFICLVGEHSDGHNYAKQAQENGAVAIVSQKALDEINIPTIIVEDTKYAIAQIAAILNDFPSKKMRLIGVTGTNGKTTVTHLIENIFEAVEIPCGLIGTLGQRMTSKGIYTDAKHTTPQAPELQQSFKNMYDNGIKNIVMEVSSHALEQYRVGECDFAGAVLTNLTQDHLDYHITMENYFKAKSKLFESLAKSSKDNKYAIINNDDPYAEKFIKSVPEGVKCLTYGILDNNTDKNSDVMAKDIEYSVNGSKFNCITPLGERTINLQLPGKFNVYNSLAALAVGIAENIPLDTCIKALEATKSVSGRFEVVAKEPLVIVDYAHTPDGLLNVINAARKIVPENGNLICLFGCGGDRDATKRPKMGKIADENCDKVIITSDNPRSEDPQQIITDILTGIKSFNYDKIMVEADRKTAIELVIKNSEKKDVIVIAGKGHEDYQILKDKTIHFDDREEAKIAYEKYKT